MESKVWTVVRHPNGMWGTGGRPDDQAYIEAEVFRVIANGREQAKKRAQAMRRATQRAAAQKGE